MTIAPTRPLDPTPDRPGRTLGRPPATLTVEVHVAIAHLANPLLAVSRLLSSEAECLVRVSGDEQHFQVSVALPDLDPDTVDAAEHWIHWAVHNAGVRGDLHRADTASGPP